MKDWLFPQERKEYSFDSFAPDLLNYILKSRGILEQKDIDNFVNCDYPISDPSRFFGMERLVLRLRESIEKFEKICIFGDYDCDGITSTVMLYSYLSGKNVDVIYMLPSRFDEGYGLSKNIIDKISSYGVNLIITVDNGVSAYNEIEYANTLGIDTIVTDHHKVPDKLPPAAAIVDPRLNSCGFKDFAGVGVVFKMIQELEKQNLSLDELLKEYGDLLCIGTIGDMVPLLDENRVLVSKSFEYLMETKRPGVRVLLEGTSFGSLMDGSEVSFGVVPKLNACGRMSSPEVAAKLLLSSSLSEARSFLQIALKMNEERKSLCSSIFENVENEILNKDLGNDRVIFAWNSEWHPGVIGIAASMICNKFGKPCFLFSVQGNEARGSARSIPGLDIHEYLCDCEELFIKYGGHSMAAGVDLKTENLEKFRKKFLNIVNGIEFPFYTIKIDCIIDPNLISIEVLNQVQKLSPFGSCNSEPIFGILNVELARVSSIGGGKHIRIFFDKDGKIFSATMFGVSKSEFLFKPGDVIDLAVRIKRNYFSGYESSVIHVVDVKFSDVNMHEFVVDQRAFEDFISGNQDLPIDCAPIREDFVDVFNFIKNNSMRSFRIERLYLNLRKKIRPIKLYLILEIFRELGIFDVIRSCSNYKIRIRSRKKVNLEESKILNRILGK